jgi:voltage-gated potassium channel Kch
MINFTSRHLKSGILHRKSLRVAWLNIVVLFIFTATVLETGLWSACYLYLGAMPSIEEAVYFSIVTFSTLGYGDIILSNEWRLLGALEAANGIIIFGWSTALVMAIIHKLYFVSSKKNQS